MDQMAAELQGAASILLQIPSIGGDHDLCSTLLTEEIEPAGVLFITYTKDPTECLEQLEGSGDARLGVITVGDGGSHDDVEIETSNVSSASDLTGLGIEIGNVLEGWEAPVTACFDSVTSMLQYVEFETAYEFLHATTGRFYAANARAHYHINPAAHDPKMLAGITSLMDVVVQIDNGQPATRTRQLIE